jgi:hypothetical protein
MPFATHEEGDYVAIDHADVFQIQNNVAPVPLAFKKSLQLGHRCVSIRPLRMNTVNLPRAAVSILKVLNQPTSAVAAVPLLHLSIQH